MQNEKKENIALPKWLKRQQQDSWQIEMLIAGSAIFSLVNLPDYLIRVFLDYSETNEFGPESIMVLFGGYVLSRALLVGFSINLMLRSLWLAYLGINFVFPKGIDYEQLDFVKNIEERLQSQANTAKRILRLEKLCSLSYSIAIILALISLGLFLCLIVVFGLFSFISETLYDSVSVGYAVMGLLLLGLFGFFSHLIFKVNKNEKIARWYWPVHRLFSFLSLSFLYRREWLVLISNIKHWKVVGIIVFYFLAAFFTSSDELKNKMNLSGAFSLGILEDREFLDVPTFNHITSNRYDNLIQEGDYIFRAGLAKDALAVEDEQSLFIVYRQRTDEAFSKILEEEKIAMEWKFKRRTDVFENMEKFSNALNRQFPVYMDDVLQKDLKWFYYTHPITKQKGFRTWLNTDSLQRGEHLIYVKTQAVRSDSLREFGYANLPFWKH